MSLSWTGPTRLDPAVLKFAKNWHDGIPSDFDRQRLLGQFVADLLSDRPSKDVELRQSFIGLDWLVRTFAPTWLDLVPALQERAAALRELKPITDIESAKAAAVPTRAAWEAAKAGSRSVMWDIAEDAMQASAGTAAANLAGKAMYSGMELDYFTYIIGDAIGAAASACAWASSGKSKDATEYTSAWGACTIQPTVVKLQDSAVDLLRRMLAIGEGES